MLYSLDYQLHIYIHYNLYKMLLQELWLKLENMTE